MNVYLVEVCDLFNSKQYLKNGVSSFFLHGLQKAKPVDDNIEEHGSTSITWSWEKVFLIQFVLSLHVFAQFLKSIKLLKIIW